MNNLNGILVDDYINEIKFHQLNILQKTTSNKKPKVNDDNTNQKSNDKFIYKELKCNQPVKKLKELTVNDQNIIKINKNIFQNLSNLVYLDLTNNNISKISKKIKLLTNLKHLILNNNLISVIPFFLTELIYLEEIQVENNLIKLIPIVIQNFNYLKILNISSNKLDKLPVELG